MLAMELLSILIGAYAAWMGPDFAGWRSAVACRSLAWWPC